jgi:hypothetical protein
MSRSLEIARVSSVDHIYQSSQSREVNIAPSWIVEEGARAASDEVYGAEDGISCGCRDVFPTYSEKRGVSETEDELS